MTQKPIPFRQGMTLMPGQSAEHSFEIPLSGGEHYYESTGEIISGRMEFREVPPPSEAPVQDKAEQLGLVRGLQVDDGEYAMDHQWRCGQCRRMQPIGSPQVWVPDNIRKSDPDWAVTEACRQNAFNGHATAWCLKCAPKADGASPVSLAAMAKKADVPVPLLVLLLCMVAIAVVGAFY